jgi:predicted RecA/RadA family phage recombinase
MNKTYKFPALWMMCLMLFSCLSFTACDNGDDENTNQYKGGVSLNVFGPSPVARGGILRFLGSGMDKVTAVVIPGCDDITDIEVVSDTEIRVTVPQTAQPGLVVLKTSKGDITTKTELTFTEPIDLESVSPVEVNPGEVITITGEYLNLIKEVIFADNVIVTEFDSQSRKELKVKVPIEAKTGQIIISDGAEIPNWIYSEEALTVALPTYTQSSAATIKAGNSLEIKGENLNWVSSVKFGDVEVSEITVSEDSKTLTVVVPATAKSGGVVLVCYSGAEVAAGEITTVIPTGLSAVPGVVKNGADITIAGKDLDLIVSATFPNVADAVELKQGASATKIAITVPELAQDGDITLNLANGESVAIAYKTLKPVITAFSPIALTAGDTVTIAGTDLDLVSAIVFAGEESPTVTLAKYNHISDKLIGITVPGVAETCAPTLILKNGMEVKTTVTLAITPATDPAIATINPSAVVQGNEFTITGKNLNTVETFYIGETKVTTFGKRTETEVEMAVPKTAKAGVTAIKMVNYEGKEFTSDVTMEVLTPEKTIWEGSVVLGNWENGCQDLAWGGYDWSTVVVGQTLYFYFEEDTSSTWWQLKLGQGSDWSTLPDFKEFAGADAVGIEAGATKFSYSLGAKDVEALQKNAGLIFQGGFLTVKKITIEVK